MADVSFAAQAKSDQLNAVDIMGVEPVITIRDVKVMQGNQQPVWVYFNGDNNRPWKVSKGMIRILIAGWGKDSDNWIGKSVQIYCDPSVKYAGKEVGGIRIKAMSDISANGIKCTIALNKQNREPYHVKFLSMERPTYPQEKFDASFDAMAKTLSDGKMTLEQVVSRCQQTGDLTPEMLSRLESAAPVVVDSEDEMPDNNEFNGFGE